MIKLNLPEYEIKVKEGPKGTQILDEIRKCYVRLTPEEWVRQNFLKYIINDIGYPSGRIAVEMFLMVNGLKKRSDIVVFDSSGKCWMIIECKSPDSKLNSSVLKQIGIYNYTLPAEYLVVTNGINHYCIDLSGSKPELRNSLPPYPLISKKSE